MSIYSAMPSLIISAGISLGLYCCEKIHQNNYESTLPEVFHKRLENTEANKGNRVVQALKMRKTSNPILRSELNKETLHGLAFDVNGAFLHYSGNCVLLARAFLYNLHNGSNVLSVDNTYPILQGMSSKESDKILFGKRLTTIKHNIQGINALESEILKQHARTGDIFYIVESEGFSINLIGYEFSVGHHFNAVVLEANHSPQVQFVDAWKTSNLTPTKQDLDEKFRESGNFGLTVLS